MTACRALFCIAEHRDNTHVDATGYTWVEPTPRADVIAHVLTVTGDHLLSTASALISYRTHPIHRSREDNP